MKIKTFLTTLLAFSLQLIFAQTPGLIVQPATGGGLAILDPNGDGYISLPTNGVQIGFTGANDVSTSEIPFAPVHFVDPLNDLLKGGAGRNLDIVGSTTFPAVQAYYSTVNSIDYVIFRMRQGGLSNAAKAYSILLDTDQKFGFVGLNADPNAVQGNAGFEKEIVLINGTAVKVYNVDGTNRPVETHSFEPFTNYSQKSVALSVFSGARDYFYDFYVPASSLGVTASTPLRMVAVTGNGKTAIIGSTNIADIMGNSLNIDNIDITMTNIVQVQTPTSLNQINTGVKERSECPTITGPVLTSATSIAGTTTEPSGTTITVKIYQNNGNLAGTATMTTTTASENWSINLSSFSPSVTLAAGQTVRATATAPNEGESYDDCSILTVVGCTQQTSTSGITITKTGKGYSVANNFPIGTIVTWYDDQFNVADRVFHQTTKITNPVTTTTANQTVLFEQQTGNTGILAGAYYFTVQYPNECVSIFVQDCQYATLGSSVAPTITTSNILPTTTSLSGTCASTSSTLINIFVDGTKIASQTFANTTTWTISSLNLTAHFGKSITVTASDAGKCATISTSSYPIRRPAVQPIIEFSGCAVGNVTSISGKSVENISSAFIRLFRIDGTRTAIGDSVAVSAEGTWTISGLNLPSGAQIVARVSSGTNLAPSIDSDTITISTQSVLTGYSITIDEVTEGDSNLSGTISYTGTFPSPTVLGIYIDEVLAKTASINSAGNWSIPDFEELELYSGAIIKASVSYGGLCESVLSDTLARVQCAGIDEKTITTTTTTCYNSNGTITVEASQTGIIYTPMFSDGTIAGYGVLGTGSDITLLTTALTSTSRFKVIATKLEGGCSRELSGATTITINPLPATPTGAATQIYCSTTSPTLANLSVASPAGTSVKWYDAATGGNNLASSTALSNGTTYYAVAMNTTTGCESAARLAVIVNSGTPTAPAASASQYFSTGAELSTLSATPNGTGSIAWYDAASGGNLLNSTDLLVNNTVYYAQTNDGDCSSIRTAVTALLANIITKQYENGSFSANSGIPSGDQIIFTDPSTEVTFTATAEEGYEFTGWQVDGVDQTAAGTGPLTITISGDASITALFARLVAYESTEDGEWNVKAWKGARAVDATFNNTSVKPKENVQLVRIKNKIENPAGNFVTTDKLEIKPNGKLENKGDLEVTTAVIFEIEDNHLSVIETGEFLNLGDIVLGNSAKIIVKKHFAASKWYFMSFPFDVTEDQIFLGGTETKATWGYPGEAGMDFYAAEYNGPRRASTNVMTTSNSQNWMRVPEEAGKKVFKANKGYIIASTVPRVIDFVSIPGNSGSGDLFSKSNKTINTNRYSAASSLHQDWNLVGTPYGASFKLNDAENFKPYYLFNGTNYSTVMADEFEVDEEEMVYIQPFSSFFLQAYENGKSLNFKVSGRAAGPNRVRALNTYPFDEINISLSNGTYTDNTRIRVQEGSTEAYDLGLDGVKILSDFAAMPQIYTTGGGISLSVNAIPEYRHAINMPVRTNVAGTYTLQLNYPQRVMSYDKILLTDFYEGTITNLKETGSYTFTTNSGTFTDRFSISLANDITTTVGNDLLEHNSVFAYVQDKVVSLEGLSAASEVRAYDIHGRQLGIFTDVENRQGMRIQSQGIILIKVKNTHQQLVLKITLQ